MTRYLCSTNRAVLARAAWGGALLGGPGVILYSLGRTDTPSPVSPVAVLRVLGARHLAQAALELRRPTEGVFTIGALSDTLHAASAIALAVCSGTWRRAALLDSTVAAGFVLTSARTARDRPPRHQLRSPR